MPNQTKNVFISHIHKDDEGLDDLKNLVARHGMVAKDYSITSDKENNAKAENYIKYDILAPRIEACSTLVVYITPETRGSQWVNWEIEYAHKQEKTIVGVWERGAKGCEIPDALGKYGDAIVGWDGNKIVDAINGDCDDFDNPDGTSFGPRPITRHPCN